LISPAEKPELPPLDPLVAAQEEARHAKEGGLKLSRSIDVMRVALETILIAEVDNKTRLPVTTKDLKGIAVEALNEYSKLTGQSWRRHPIIGSWAGDRNLETLDTP
jgi:hypothetical protein